VPRRQRSKYAKKKKKQEQKLMMKYRIIGQARPACRPPYPGRAGEAILMPHVQSQPRRRPSRPNEAVCHITTTTPGHG
jgi:hypothetical protein